MQCRESTPEVELPIMSRSDLGKDSCRRVERKATEWRNGVVHVEEVHGCCSKKVRWSLVTWYTKVTAFVKVTINLSARKGEIYCNEIFIYGLCQRLSNILGNTLLDMVRVQNNLSSWYDFIGHSCPPLIQGLKVQVSTSLPKS